MWIILVKGTELAIGAAWHHKEDAQKVADNLEPKHGEEFEVVFQEIS